MENEEERSDMLEELIDRFGEPPKSVMNLLEITKVKSMARRLYIKEVKGRPDQITFTMYEKAQINAAKIPGSAGADGWSTHFPEDGACTVCLHFQEQSSGFLRKASGDHRADSGRDGSIIGGCTMRYTKMRKMIRQMAAGALTAFLLTGLAGCGAAGPVGEEGDG